MLTQLIGKLNTREVMHAIVGSFYSHPHTRHDDTFHRSITHKDGTTYTTVVKHPQSGTFLIVEKTECGIIRVASDAGDNHSEMFKIGLTQLESEMPAVKVKKKRKSPKVKAAAKAEVAASLDVGGMAAKKPSKPRARKPKATKQ
jgi:hypothetical protein